jgi:hypothetical protein
MGALAEVVTAGTFKKALLHSESKQSQNPPTIALRSQAQSVIASTTRENDTGWLDDHIGRSTSGSST